MQLTPEQAQELLKLIDKNQLLITGAELGPEFFTEYDKQLLRSHGIDFNTIFTAENSSITTSFHLGMLAEALGATEAAKLAYPEIKQYVKAGNYLPVSDRQKAALNSIKMQSFSSLKTLNGNIFADVNKVITDKTLAGQQQFLADELAQGIAERKTVSQIAHAIAEKTGDWGRNFDRIIETASQNAFETGKAAEIERKSPDEDPLVYKQPQQGACKHCIRLYLTDGWGSQPIIFKLSALRANGDNIGRKVADWKAVVGTVHPFCRCPLSEVPKGYLWNPEKLSFSTPDPNYRAEIAKKRPLIKVVIGGKEKYL